jgi:quercetin dioxygenase-like cupin family protein
MEKLDVQTEIGEGKDTEVTVLFDGPARKIIQITLRRQAILKAHKSDVAITVQCVAGSGKFIEVEGDIMELTPGALITVEPNVVHEVRAMPNVSIVVTKFTGT